MKRTTKLLLFAAVIAVFFAFAAVSVFADYTAADAEIEEKIALALEDAKTQDVTITFSGTWTFTGDTVFKCTDDTIPDYKITINGESGAAIQSGGYMPAFWGNFEFNGINFVGSKTGGTTRIDAKNGMYFPEGCSGVIGTGCSGSTDGTTGFNLAGDSLTVNSGSFRVIAAQMLSNANTVAIDNPKITVQGTASAQCVCGLGYNADSLTGAADLKVLGGANITEFLVAGGYYSNSARLGGNLTVNTDANSTIRNIAAVVGASGCYDKNNIPKYTVTVGSSATLTTTYGVSAFIFNGHSSFTSTVYIDADITINDGVVSGGTWFLSARPGPGGGSSYFYKTGGKVKATINGGTWYVDSSHRYSIYGGGSVIFPGTVVGNDVEIVINGGRLDLVSGGSSFNAASYRAAGASEDNPDTKGYDESQEYYSEHTGDMVVRYNSFTSSSNNKYGGSTLGATKSVQSGEVTVYIGNPEMAQLSFPNAIYTAGLLNNATATITGDSRLVIDNARCTGHLVAGAWINKAGAKMLADTELEFISGTASGSYSYNTSTVTESWSGIMTGGCYSTGVTGVIEDTDPDDKITGGFAHVGNVHVLIHDGVGALSGRKSFTGVGVNVDGDSTVEIYGGTFSEFSCKRQGGSTTTYFRLSFLSDKAPGNDKSSNTDVFQQSIVSITGDLKIYIGGTAYIGAGAIRIDEGAANYYPGQGYGVVGGNIYWEISESASFSNNAQIVANGYGNAGKDVFVKYVGNGFTAAKATAESTTQFIHLNNAASANRVSGTHHYYLDLTLVESGTFFDRITNGTTINVNSNSSTWTAVYLPAFDTATLDVTGATFEEGKSPLTGSTISATFDHTVVHSTNVNATSYTRTWADIEAWDEYAIKDANKTANAFSATKVGESTPTASVGKFTPSATYEVTSGSITDTIDLVNTEIATVTAATQDEFDYLGVSIRAADNGLRARAQVNETLRNRTLAADGYKVKSYGILVSKTATGDLTLGGAKTTAAVAYNGTTDVYFLDGTNYVFAAAVTGIPAANYNTQLTFRPYVELEDEDGNTLVVYADMTGVSNFLDGNNVKVSLKEAATFVRDNEVAYYNANKDAIDAIINA